LEERLAAFTGRERALVFSTGYQTNLGTISALIGRGDVVITDRDDHASIVDGCRLSFGEMKRFRHSEMADLERVLKGCGPDLGKMVVVDGVYSMGGDIAPLPQLVPLCQKYGARLMVDDAHSIGVLGNGRGTAAHFGITAGVDLVMGTFSKSFASLGGFIAGDEPVIHYVQHFARSLIFSASMPPANVAACLAALDIMETETWRYDRLAEISTKMREGYRSMGFDVGHTETPIIPLIIGDDMKTLLMWRALFDAGIYVNPVIPPAVPPNMSLLRTSYMATHSDEQLDRVLETVATVAKQAG
jgi:8-amino-7-oxononanoate synthase